MTAHQGRKWLEPLRIAYIGQQPKQNNHFYGVSLWESKQTDFQIGCMYMLNIWKTSNNLQNLVSVFNGRLLKCLDCTFTQDVLGEIRLASLGLYFRPGSIFSQLAGLRTNRIKGVMISRTLKNGVSIPLLFSLVCLVKKHSPWTQIFLPMFHFPLCTW